MRIEIRGRNIEVTEELREHVRQALRPHRAPGLRPGDARGRADGGAQPLDPRQPDRRGAPSPEGRDPARARASPEMLHSIKELAEDMRRQVKRHREKRRKRWQSRRLASAACAAARPDAGRPTRLASRSESAPLYAESRMARGLHRSRPAAGRGAQVQGVRAPGRRRSTASSPRWSCSTTPSSARAPTSCASARDDGEPLDDLLPEAFALCREAGKRTLGQRHFDVQLIGGMVLHSGAIAEMKTGEGKTLTATLAVFLNTLAGDAVHLVTVNDYLARRDAEWMKPDLRRARRQGRRDPGHEMQPAERRARRTPRRHLRHQLRVRLRLPARQHGAARSRTASSAATPSRSSTRSTTS